MNFLKCLAIGMAVASGLVTGIVGGFRLANYLAEKYDKETSDAVIMLSAIFLIVSVFATLICYFAPATHN